MTIIPVNALSPSELNQLGNNFDDDNATAESEVAAINRSLAPLGEAIEEQIEAALASEHVAS